MSERLILIVEDNEKNRKLLRDMLQVSGYRTLESETAEEGIELAEQHRPALVLMDIQLPGIDGVEALKRLRSNSTTARIPVIAITASAMKNERSEIANAGFDGYQAKPVDIKEILAAVKDALRRGRAR